MDIILILYKNINGQSDFPYSQLNWTYIYSIKRERPL